MLTITCSCSSAIRWISLNTARRSVLSRVIGRFRMRPLGTSGASWYIMSADVADDQVVAVVGGDLLDEFEVGLFLGRRPDR